MQSTTLILNIGYDSSLLDTRTMLLRAAGYTVLPSRFLESVIPSLRTDEFDLIVLCHSLSASERAAILKLLQDGGSLGPVFLVDPLALFDSGFETAPAIFLRRVAEMVGKNRLKG